jgi:hypothetical protein
MEEVALDQKTYATDFAIDDKILTIFCGDKLPRQAISFKDFDLDLENFSPDDFFKKVEMLIFYS